MRTGVVVAISVGAAVLAGAITIATFLDDDTDDGRRDDSRVCAELAAAINRYRSNEAGSDILAIRAMIEDLDAIAAEAVGTELESVADAAAEATLEDTPDAIDDFGAECGRQGLEPPVPAL